MDNNVKPAPEPRRKTPKELEEASDAIDQVLVLRHFLAEEAVTLLLTKASIYAVKSGADPLVFLSAVVSNLRTAVKYYETRGPRVS